MRGITTPELHRTSNHHYDYLTVNLLGLSIPSAPLCFGATADKRSSDHMNGSFCFISWTDGQFADVGMDSHLSAPLRKLWQVHLFLCTFVSPISNGEMCELLRFPSLPWLKWEQFVGNFLCVASVNHNWTFRWHIYRQS